MGTTFDLTTKINRAVRALLVQTGVGKPESTYAGEAVDTTVERVLPSITVEAGVGTEDEWMPGNFRFGRVEVILRNEAITQQDDPNPLSPFLAANQMASAVLGQLLLSDDTTTLDYTRRQINAAGRALAVDSSNGANAAQSLSAANNADMTDFTILFWQMTDYGTTRRVDGQDEHKSFYFERVATFECVACNSNID